MLGVTFKRTIVVSAVAVKEGGELELLRQCLQQLSKMASDGRTRIVALVHNRQLCDYPHVEYKEYPEAAVSAKARRKCEYKQMYWDSVLMSEQDDKPIDLWLSMFDVTPDVQAKCRVTFCYNAFPWLKVRPRDWMMDRAIPLSVRSSKAAYRKNIGKNDYLVVRQDALRQNLSRTFHTDPAKTIVFPAKGHSAPERIDVPAKSAYTFFLPSTPDCYKNFETACEAARLLELEIGRRRFRAEFTVRGEDNKYGWWLKSNWDHVDSIHFAGWQSPSRLWGWYEAADCLIYPSRAENWGRPITEFAPSGKPMLLADLPYAHEAAAGAPRVAFFPDDSPEKLKELMKALVLGDERVLSPAPYHHIDDPKVFDWEELFHFLLPDDR